MLVKGLCGREIESCETIGEGTPLVPAGLFPISSLTSTLTTPSTGPDETGGARGDVRWEAPLPIPRRPARFSGENAACTACFTTAETVDESAEAKPWLEEASLAGTDTLSEIEGCGHPSAFGS